MVHPIRNHRSLAITAIAALALCAATPLGWANDELEFEDAEIFFELNNTDQDLGIHALIDGEPWKKLEIEDPEERTLLKIRTRSRLRRQGLTELFFESAEPVFAELSPEEFFERFPEGTYEVEGVTLDGEEIESETEVTHDVPAPPDPTLTGASGGVNGCIAEDDELVISWPQVTTTHPDLGNSGEAIVVENYELVVEAGDAELSLILPRPDDADPIEVELSELIVNGAVEALEDGEVAKFEVLVREESFNQTATEVPFVLCI